MDVADEQSVLGDFNDTTFVSHGHKSRFYRKGKRYFVHTRGPGGKEDDFQISYTFGFSPLQQYLIAFPGGRLQCLTIAWDVEKKRWFDLYPKEDVAPSDWLYWTNQGQNWNGMCAECHSTRLTKGYNPESDTYHTTWSEIDVSCEACHGPGSKHLKWASLPAMARPQLANFDLTVQTSELSSRQLVELCARCHARRSFLGDYRHPQGDILDKMLPQLLSPGMYYADGQILEEDYVYASFLQSKMYNHNVRCSDCHDVHSLKRLKEGNALCLQCHRAQIYDRKEHHFHKQEGEKGEVLKRADGKIFPVGSGAKCENCHMPGRYYMGVDYRPDHSIRVPRPDLSETNNTPNACNRCHADKSSKWAADYLNKWYGISKKSHYGTVMAAARQGGAMAQTGLIAMAQDHLLPVIVRASALAMLRSYPQPKSISVLTQALDDNEALIRYAAIRTLDRLHLGPEQYFDLTSLLYDPVKGVRMEAAMALSRVAPQLHGRLKELFDQAIEEYRLAMNYSADFPQSQFNLGLMASHLGNREEAEKHYKRSSRIDEMFYPAKVNLAMLYNEEGKNDQAEILLRQATVIQPDMAEISYSLGLLLVEKKSYEEAVKYLEKAAAAMAGRARVHYNLGLLEQKLGKQEKAEAALLRALSLEPDSKAYLYALATHYLGRSMFTKAAIVANKMAVQDPKDPTGYKILRYIAAKSAEKNSAK